MSREYDTESASPLLVLEDCPSCGARLRVRRRRADGKPFLACSAWPRCDFAEDLDERIQRLAYRIGKLEAELLAAQAHRAPLPTETIAKQLRELIVYTHPDRWPGNPLAHEATVRLTALRDRVRAAG